MDRTGGCDPNDRAEVTAAADAAAQSLPAVVATMLRFASLEEIAELLARPQVRARIEQGLADLDAGRVVGLHDEEGLVQLLGELDAEHGPVDPATGAEVDAEVWLDDDAPRA